MSTTPTWAPTHLPPGIEWFGGDVDAAFAAAKAANKPVFLYWGAEWCPPCAQIKTTIFSKREFQERSRLFVPVYLDGDTPSAQKHGERFGVVGYPTMILFKPDGTEITRLPGGVDVARYARILDVALADARPVSDILAAARSGDPVTSNDWRLLAYLLVGHRQRPRAAGRPGTGDVPRAGASLPSRTAGRMRTVLLRLPRRRCRCSGTREASARWPRARRCARQAAGAAAIACSPGGERRQPAVRGQGRDRRPVE